MELYLVSESIHKTRKMHYAAYMYQNRKYTVMHVINIYSYKYVCIGRTSRTAIIHVRATYMDRSKNICGNTCTKKGHVHACTLSTYTHTSTCALVVHRALHSYPSEPSTMIEAISYVVQSHTTFMHVIDRYSYMCSRH